MEYEDISEAEAKKVLKVSHPPTFLPTPISQLIS
jgi:hypothetical protein